MVTDHCATKDIGSVTGDGIIESSITSSDRKRPHDSDYCAGKDTGSVTGDEKIESCIISSDRKRPHYSSLNDSQAEFSANKKQAVQSPTPKVNLVAKPKQSTASCGFPRTVRNLTCTGIFDGVPVKYISTSGQVFRGRIKGTGYLCGCEECKFSKVLKADEFERHAGCKTKHPNCRIYFENGKTVYGVVQKLRRIPENLLFENIQTATGSPINEKNFSAWKDMFQSASHNQQRIVSEVEQSKGTVTEDLPSCN